MRYLAMTCAIVWSASVGAQPNQAPVPVVDLLTKTVDEFTGHTYWLSAPVDLLSDGEVYGGTVTLRVQRFLQKGKSVPSYQLFVDYAGDEWIFAPMHRSLILLIDGQAVTLSAAGEPDRETKYGGIKESLMYDVSPGLLRRFAAAKVLKVRLAGTRLNIDRLAGPNVRAIVNAVLNPATTLARRDSAIKAGDRPGFGQKSGLTGEALRDSVYEEIRKKQGGRSVPPPPHPLIDAER